MFQRIKQRFNDMKTIHALCQSAEAHALADHQQVPAAEHFLLAALDLPDGSAQRAFQRIQANPAELKPAIARQYADALHNVGVAAEKVLEANSNTSPPAPPATLYNAAPSGQAVMQTLAARRKQDKPLLGAHVVAVITTMQQGIAARSLRTMGIDLNTLRDAAEQEIASQ